MRLLQSVSMLSYPELKYESSSPTDLMGFERLERFETTPKLTRMFRSRPSHNNETSCSRIGHLAITLV